MKLHYLSTIGLKSLLFLIGSSAPALANWQDTEWGMSQREIGRMFPAVVETDEGLSLAGYPVLDGDGTAIFGFGESGLERVRLNLDLSLCRSVLKHHLVLRYGQPLTVEVSNSMSSVRTATYWIDHESGNMVLHYLFEGGSEEMCSIVYAPIPQKNAVGGL